MAKFYYENNGFNINVSETVDTLVCNLARGNGKSIFQLEIDIKRLADIMADCYIITTKRLNPRITHLAYHSKKARVRKKNKARLYRFACKLAGISSKEA